MGTYIKVETSDELDEHFQGTMIEASDMFVDKYFVPGWECKHCGWRIGTAKLPPSHICPDDGEEQALASAIAEYAKLVEQSVISMNPLGLNTPVAVRKAESEGGE